MSPSYSLPFLRTAVSLFCAGLGLPIVPASAAPESAAESRAKIEVDWPAFLGRHDPIWRVLPHQWNEGAYLGNGQLGLVANATPGGERFDLHLGRVDVTDHRKAPDLKTSRGVPGAGVMYDFPRLHLGRMSLRPAGKILGGTLRTDLWNAEFSGTLETDRGRIELRAVTLRDRMAHRIDVRSTERDATGAPLPWTWEFTPGNPASPRAQVFPDRPESKAYETNPPPRLTEIDGVPVCVQALLAGGDYATAWLDERTAPGEGTLYLTTANEVPATGVSGPLAVRTVREAAAAAAADLAAHRAWWHAFYPAAFLSLPDARLESFYWLQIHKLASASRPDAPPIDVLGPFHRVSQWPGLWWNLNVQLTYWPAYAGNRLELGTNLLDELDTHFDTLHASFAKGGALGDFAWVLHNYWLHLRHAGDWAALHTRWSPKAAAVFRSYAARLRPGSEGKLDLPAMESPEYEGFKTYDNTAYNLALLRWLASSLLEAEARAGVSPSSESAEWRRVLLDLAPYPQNENGLMIARGVPVAKSHRHYSHLLALYPLFQLNPDSPEDRELVMRSVRHWHHVGDGKALAGYSYTGGASLYAALGLGDEAHGMLTRFLTGSIGISQLLPNTLYVESDGRNPVIETPLSAAASTTELLFQSWGGKLRVFPAVPSSWGDAVFHQLRGQGGFLVSAVRERGRTAWVQVHSEAGEPCVVKVPDWSRAPIARGGGAAVEQIAPGEFRVALPRGATVLLTPEGSASTPVVRPLAHEASEANLYGLTERTRLKRNQNWPEVPVEPVR